MEAFFTRFSSHCATPSSHADHSHAVAAMPRSQGRPRTRYVAIVLLFCHVLARNGRRETLVVTFSSRISSPHAIPSSHADHRHVVTVMPRPQERPRTRYVAISLYVHASVTQSVTYGAQSVVRAYPVGFGWSQLLLPSARAHVTSLSRRDTHHHPKTEPMHDQTGGLHSSKSAFPGDVRQTRVGAVYDDRWCPGGFE